MIVNRYEEPGEGFEGTFTCIDGSCTDEQCAYAPECEVCEKKQPRSSYDEDQEDRICNRCRAEHKAGD